MHRVLAVSVFALASCGVLTSSSYCDFRQGSANGPEPRCQERVDSLVTATEAFKATCDVLKGKSGDGPCPRDGVVAGCEIGTQGDGSKVNNWYYAPRTVAEIQKECADDKGQFLNP